MKMKKQRYIWSASATLAVALFSTAMAGAQAIQDPPVGRPDAVIDDYAEVWVNGKMPRVLGQLGGAVIKGFNAPNRVIITRDAQPGQPVQLAVFGINGPISYSPQNFIWIKSATLDFYKSPKVAISETPATIIRKDPALDEIVPAGAKIEKLAGGFLFTEGPIWVPRMEDTDGYLLFSDPNNNLIYRWTQDGQLSIFLTKSGYRGMDIGEYGQPGSNGLTLDKQGRLTINQHGNRRVVRMEKNDQKGNLYVSGPGGLWIISAEGKHLGTIVGPEHPHNFAWGDDDGKTLYLCAKTGLYRIRLNIPGIRP